MLDRQELLRKYGWENRLRVLDHGHVYLVDQMGDDFSIEQAARVSYQQGTRPTSTTRGLIRYLKRHRHTTPFEACVVTLGMRIPIFVARQLVRHRTQSINEESARYSVIRDEFFIPDMVNYQSKDNKQGRAEPLPDDQVFLIREQMRAACLEDYKLYSELLALGVARETARATLPLSTYTEWQTTMSVHNLLHMLTLRLDKHAQLETRMVMEAVAQIVRDWLPLSWEAFEDYQLFAKTFSRMELELLGQVIDVKLLRDLLASDHSMDRREHAEFLEKLCLG